jgi:4'-phosphopantetheinyl transferase
MLGNAIEVVVVRLDVAAGAVRAAAALLSEEERQRAGRFVQARERCRFTVARAELRRLLGTRLQARPEAIELAYGRRGKPALAGPLAESGLRFNVSHHDGIAAYAFAHRREIGIDVEAVRAIADADDIAVRAFSRRECASYFALEARDRPLAFFNCWTRKEAFVKALGEGLSHGLDGFDVSLAPGEPARLLRVAGVPGEWCGWALHGFVPAPGMTGALVVRQSDAQAAPVVLPALFPDQAAETAHERIAA